jgi:hypothetical protein
MNSVIIFLLTLLTPTPVNLASNNSCLRGSRLCNSSIISIEKEKVGCEVMKTKKGENNFIDNKTKKKKKKPHNCVTE